MELLLNLTQLLHVHLCVSSGSHSTVPLSSVCAVPLALTLLFLPCTNLHAAHEE
jgi:hypothetical protein